MSFVVGVDLGQASDFTAKAFVQREHRPTNVENPQQGTWHEEHYTIRQLQRPPLKTPYTDIVRDLRQDLGKPELQGADLVVDATGVGRSVIDFMRAEGLNPIAVTITAGQQITQHENGFWHVPKRVLVSSMAVALQTGRLHVVRTLEHAPTWMREAAAFKVKISKAANESYEAWREGDHDDLMLATSLAVWWAELTSRGEYRHTRRSMEAAAKQERLSRFRAQQERPFWDRRGKKRFAR